METPHLSGDEDSNLKDDLTLVDLESNDGDEHAEVQNSTTIDDLSSTQNDNNNEKTDDISLTGLNAMSNVPEDGSWESDNLFKDLPYEEKNLGDKANDSSLSKDESLNILPTSKAPSIDINTVSSSSGSIPISTLSPSSSNNDNSFLPKITIKGILSESNQNPSNASPIILKPLNTHPNNESVYLNSEDKDGAIVLEAADARKFIECNMKRQQAVEPVKNPPQVVYVKPPPGAKIVNPSPKPTGQQILLQGNFQNQGSVLVPANTMQGQNKQLVLQPVPHGVQNNSHVLIPAGPVLNPDLKRAPILIPVNQSNSTPILVPSATNKNILVPLTASSAANNPILLPSTSNTKTVYLSSSQTSNLSIPISATSGKTVFSSGQKGIPVQTLTHNHKFILPSNKPPNSSSSNAHTFIMIPKQPVIKPPPKPLAPKISTKTPFNPKPGQIVLQTADGQKLLLQPIEGSKSSGHMSEQQKVIFHQGQVNPTNIAKPTNVPIQQKSSQLVAYATATTSKPFHSQTKVTTRQLTTSGIKKDMLTVVPNSPDGNEKTKQMTLKINVENAQGEVKETIQKQYDLDSSELKKKSVLLDILTTKKSTEKKNMDVDDDIAVFEISKEPSTSRDGGKAVDSVDKHTELGMMLNKKMVGSKSLSESSPKLPVSTGIGGMTYFKKTVKESGEMSCFVPLEACGSASLDHLISLAQKPPRAASPLESPVVCQESSPPTASVQTLLKHALQHFPSKQLNVSNSNRRKQALSNRNAEMDLAIVKMQGASKPKSKRRQSPTKRPSARRPSSTNLHTPVESDEVISSITDFDLVHMQKEMESNEEIDVMNPLPEDTNPYNIEIKKEPVSPTEERPFSFDTSDVDLNIKREREEDDFLDTNFIKKEQNEEVNETFGKSGVLSSEDLVRRSFRIYNNPSHKSVHIEPTHSNRSNNQFIPLTNFLSDSPEVKFESANDFNPDEPYDYSNIEGPVSVSITKGMKKIKALMSLKDLEIRDIPDFRIIESRFAINCVRNVYSCNLCKGEYCTINMKSLADHLIMHQKFPKIHQLVTQRPYEVSGLSGNEVSSMAGNSGMDGLNLDQFFQSQSLANPPSADKKFHCKLCPYKAKTTATMQSHMNVHSMASRAVCDICNIVYRNTKVVEIHKTNEHGIRHEERNGRKDARTDKRNVKKEEMTERNLVYVSARPL